jgi:hypothetical protein
MIQYLDDPNMPPALRRVLESEYYTEGLDQHFGALPAKYRDCNLSVTSLTKSPRQRVLFMRHSHKIVLRMVAKFYRIWGHVVHVILEDAARDDKNLLIEQRFGVPFTYQSAPGLLKGVKRNGKPVPFVYFHGQLDEYSIARKKINDWKVTSTYAAMKKPKVAYEQQLNMLAYLCRSHGWAVDTVSNTFLFKEWDERKIKEGSNYPESPYLVRDIPLWDNDEIEDYIRGRLRAHLEAESMEDDDLPHCNAAELWADGPSEWKVYRVEDDGTLVNNAKHTNSTRDGAVAWTQDPENTHKKKVLKRKSGDVIEMIPLRYEVKEIKPQPVACDWCEIREYCNQYRDRIAMESGESKDASVNREVPEWVP